MKEWQKIMYNAVTAQRRYSEMGRDGNMGFIITKGILSSVEVSNLYVSLLSGIIESDNMYNHKPILDAQRAETKKYWTEFLAEIENNT